MVLGNMMMVNDNRHAMIFFSSFVSFYLYRLIGAIYLFRPYLIEIVYFLVSQTPGKIRNIQICLVAQGINKLLTENQFHYIAILAICCCQFMWVIMYGEILIFNGKSSYIL